MEHLISIGDDGSWKEICDEKLEQLKEKDFTRREDEDADALQLRQFKESYVIENIFMDFKIYNAIKDGDPDKFVEVLEDVCEKKKLPLINIFSPLSRGGDSLLHVAAKYGNEKIAELVACHHPDLVLEKTIEGNTALHDAARSTAGGSKVIKVILSQYDAMNDTSEVAMEDHLTRRKNHVGNTALHEAVACGNLDGVAELYLRDKAAAHELNNSNKSPLYIAVYNYMRWNINIVKLNQPEDKNKTAKGIVDCLMQDSLASNKPNPKWNRGQCPLHAAIEAVSGFFCFLSSFKSKEVLAFSDYDTSVWS